MDRITRLFGVQPGSTRRTGRWVVPGALAVLLVTALFAVSCEPNLVQDPPEATNSTSANQFEKAQPQDILVERLPDKDPAQLEAALDKLNMARAAGDLTEEQYQVHVKRLTEGMKGVWKLHSVEPHLEGGDVLLHLDSGDKATFHKVMPQSDEGALNEWIQDIDGAPHLEGQIVWEAADGTKLTKEQLEQEHRKLYFGESPENLTEIHIDKLAPQNETPQ